jgi:hypothetical protein
LKRTSRRIAIPFSPSIRADPERQERRSENVSGGCYHG